LLLPESLAVFAIPLLLALSVTTTEDIILSDESDRAKHSMMAAKLYKKVLRRANPMIPLDKGTIKRDYVEWESGDSFSLGASLDSACRCFYFSHCATFQKDIHISRAS
jgi:hypothetical protein